jgi:hypothetical protein
MLRSSLLLALFALPVLAQRSPSIALGDPAGRPAMQEVNLDTVHVRASPEGTNALGLQGGQIDPTSVAVVMTRDLLPAVQGNLDRESLERENGESR